MEAKINHIKRLANELASRDEKMTFAELANNLNTNGFTNNYGNPYQKGGRGIAKLVDSIYQRLNKQGLTNERDNIAEVFTDANGNYSYEK